MLLLIYIYVKIIFLGTIHTTFTHTHTHALWQSDSSNKRTRDYRRQTSVFARGFPFWHHWHVFIQWINDIGISAFFMRGKAFRMQAWRVVCREKRGGDWGEEKVCNWMCWLNISSVIRVKKRERNINTNWTRSIAMLLHLLFAATTSFASSKVLSRSFFVPLSFALL